MIASVPEELNSQNCKHFIYLKIWHELTSVAGGLTQVSVPQNTFLISYTHVEAFIREVVYFYHSTVIWKSVLFRGTVDPH